MHTIFAFSALLALAQAQANPFLIEERDDTTFQCIISAASTIDNSFTINAGANAPTSNQNVQSLLSVAMYGSDGSQKLLWNDTGKTNLLGTPKTTIKASDTGLFNDIAWDGHNENGWQWCECQYGNVPKNHSTDISQNGDSFFLTTHSVKTCNCGVPCHLKTEPVETLTPFTGKSLPPATVNTPDATTKPSASSTANGAGVAGAIASVVGNGAKSSGKTTLSTATANKTA